MTRTYTERPVWVWKCDSCGKEQGLATEQNHLPGVEVMRAQGWFIADKWGDKCPECVQAGEDPCKCHSNFAFIAPTHSGHCCFLPEGQTCHPDEVAEWQRERSARLSGSRGQGGESR